jgi:hypothetical protein
MRSKIRASMTLVLCLTAPVWAARSAGAQFLQYTPPGGPTEKPASRREELDREIAAARFHLGPVRIAPWASLHDLSYVRSILVTGEAQPSDFTATAGAGFRAYLRNGPKVVWTAQVLPEYVWWLRQADRRQLNGRYLLDYSGFFNHLTVEVQGGREQQQQLATPELPVPVSSRRDGAEIVTELAISGAFSAFAATSIDRQNNLVDDLGDPQTAQLRLLDREERVLRGGLRWHPDPQWSVALGAERSQVDFEHDTLDRSNSGTAPVTEIRFEGSRIRFEADAADRSLESSRGAEFVPYHKVTGNAALVLGTAGRLGMTLYTSRNLVYSLSNDYAYFDDQRVGVSLNLGFGDRTRGRVFFEGGTDSYTAFSASTPQRREDVSSFGASLAVELRHGISVAIQGLRSQFNSNLPGGDRSYTSVGTTVNLMGFQ